MTDGNPTVVITADETLPGVVERLRGAASGGRIVHLVVPIDSALLLTASEFRTLKDAIDENRLAVVVRTSDPLRLQLAERLGIRAQTLPRARVAVAPVTLPPAPPAAAPGSPAAPVEGDGEWPGETAIAGTVIRLDPALQWPSQNGPTGLTGDGEILDESDPEASPIATLDNPPRRWLPVAAVLAALVAGTFLVIRFVLPQAVVTIVPRSVPVAASLVFDVTVDGQPLDATATFVLRPQERQIEVVWEGTVPVTGVRLEPDGTASSFIELRNASTDPMAVDAGTIVATETGVEFAFAEAVAVPAANPATGRPGAATGRVQAVQAGGGGNASTGEIGGRLPNGVYYSNRMQPAKGGSDKEFPVVAQTDLDALGAAAKGAAPELAAAAVAQEQPGQDVINSTVTVSGQRDEFDHRVGEEVDSISSRSTMMVDVLTYDGDAAGKEYKQMLALRLSDEAPEGFAVGAGDIVYDEPVLAEESDRGVRLEVVAQTDADAVLDEAEREALAAELAGVSPEQAAAILARLPEIASYTVDYRPSWLPDQMPNSVGRIQLEIAE